MIEAASVGVRTLRWQAGGTSPNSQLLRALASLQNRTREQFQNNPWIRRSIESIVSNEIGTGIRWRANTQDEKFNEQMRLLVNRWVEVASVDRVLDFYGLQRQISLARNQSGECFVKLSYRSSESNLPIPLQIQVLESEFVSTHFNQQLTNGNRVKAGIEFNRRNQIVAYWIYEKHPQEGMSKKVRVKASQVLHCYNPTRPGQLRGEPVSIASLLKAKTFDQYDDAELVRKQTRSALTGFIKKDYNEEDALFDPITGDPLPNKLASADPVQIKSGSWVEGNPGEEPILFDGDNSGSGYADFMRQQLLAVASGFGVPYEIVTGDWSKVNDRLVRAILNEFRRHIQMNQQQLIIAQVCRPLWHALVRWGFVTNRFDLPAEASWNDYLSVDFLPQAWAYVNPAQDVSAKIEAIKAGLTSRSAVVAENGKDAEEVDAQRKADQAREALLGVA